MDIFSRNHIDLNRQILWKVLLYLYFIIVYFQFLFKIQLPIFQHLVNFRYRNFWHHVTFRNICKYIRLRSLPSMRFKKMYGYHITLTVGRVLALNTFIRFQPCMNNEMSNSLIPCLKFLITMGALQIPWLVIATQMNLQTFGMCKAYATVLAHVRFIRRVFDCHMNLELYISSTF